MTDGRPQRVRRPRPVRRRARPAAGARRPPPNRWRWPTTPSWTSSADEAAARVEETLAALDAELVGLAPVKRRVREIASLLLVDRARGSSG